MSERVLTTYQIRNLLRHDQQADFEAWLAEHDAQVRAEALREAAAEQADREPTDASFDESEMFALEWCVSHLIEKSPFSQVRVAGRVVTFADLRDKLVAHLAVREVNRG